MSHGCNRTRFRNLKSIHIVIMSNDTRGGGTNKENNYFD